MLPDNINELMYKNATIFDAFETAQHMIETHNKPAVSISGGSDSDIILDIIYRVDDQKKCRYIWFDTGLEYEATKDHIKFLEKKYGIHIDRIRPKMTVPASVRKYGQPFISKYVSAQIEKLQKAGFNWEDEPYSVLAKRYPDGGSAIKWWCNQFKKKTVCGRSFFDIDHNGKLKEFLMGQPPTFKVSAKCCTYAKKNPSHQLMRDGYDLSVTGVRKCEGGIRSRVYDQCFSKVDGFNLYMPIFFFTDEDKEEYCKIFNVTHSECYTKWGFKRTGCSCCPFSRDLSKELDTLDIYEPRLGFAARNVFKESYEYTNAWLAFRKINYGYIHFPRSRARVIRCVETGEEFDMIKTAAESKGIKLQSISNCLHGDSKTAGGYHWEYADGKKSDYGTWIADTKRKECCKCDS